MSCVTSSGGYLVCENVNSLTVGRAVSDPVMSLYRIYMYIPFKTLNVFPTDFVVQYVSNLVRGNLFSCGTLVDTRREARVSM